MFNVLRIDIRLKTMTDEKKNLCLSLFKAGVFKIGTFFTRTGVQINSYFDLLIVTSLPSLMDEICILSSKECKKRHLNVELVCAVPYSAFSFAFLIASKLQKPFLFRKKEIQFHSKESRIEGNKERRYCLVVEEVTSSGYSVLETIRDLESEGVLIKDVFSIIDLEQGASENLNKFGYKLHSLLKLSELAEVLYSSEVISLCEYNNIQNDFCNQFAPNGDCITKTNLGGRRSVPYEDRIKYCKSKVAQKLFSLMVEKKSNLCLNFCTRDFKILIQVADLIGAYISILIVHLDVFDDINEEEISKLQQISKKYNFLLMDDRKLSEDDDIAIQQCLRILESVDLLSIQLIFDENILNKTKDIIEKHSDKGIFVVASPTVNDTLVNSNYEKNCIDVTLEFFDNVAGFMSHKNSSVPLGYVHMMSDKWTTASTAKQINSGFYSPEIMIGDIGADIVQLIHDDITTVEVFAKKQQILLWNAYMQRFRTM